MTWLGMPGLGNHRLEGKRPALKPELLFCDLNSCSERCSSLRWVSLAGIQPIFMVQARSPTTGGHSRQRGDPLFPPHRAGLISVQTTSYVKPTADYVARCSFIYL